MRPETSDCLLSSPGDATDPWLNQVNDNVVLRLRVQPGAKRTQILGPLGDQLKVAIQATPVDGQANEALLRWLANSLGVRLSHVSLTSGQSSRNKRVQIQQMTVVALKAALGL